MWSVICFTTSVICILYKPLGFCDIKIDFDSDSQETKNAVPLGVLFSGSAVQTFWRERWTGTHTCQWRLFHSEAKSSQHLNRMVFVSSNNNCNINFSSEAKSPPHLNRRMAFVISNNNHNNNYLQKQKHLSTSTEGWHL